MTHVRWMLVGAALAMSACDGCEDTTPVDMSPTLDMGDPPNDMSGPQDLGPADTPRDLPEPPEDASSDADLPEDVGPRDADEDLATDAARDASSPDETADLDASEDAGTTDADMSTNTQDMTADMEPPMGACASGAMGSWAARFRWEGNGPSSRAYVVYEANNLPDTSRWKASANARNIGYMPVYNDTFLGVGGLQMSGTVFMDVELSTVGLPPGTQATLSIFGRSYNTTSPGSFSWRTFSGSGQSPRGSVFNSAPYQWYSADATVALPPGDGSTLLRIEPEGPSGALIVRAVEICFRAP